MTSADRRRALLIHGVPTDGRLWRGVAEALGPSVEVLAPDLPGFGAAPAIADPTPARLAEALLPLVDARTDLVGHDLGGLLAAWIAARRPVRSLVLCSTALGPGWLPSRLTALPPLNRYFYRRYAGQRWLAMGVGPAKRAALLAQYDRADPAWMEAIARRLPVGAGGRWRPTAPTLCLWGAADRSFPAWGGRRLARRLGAAWEALPGSRHYAMWEEPEAFAGALARFWGL